jgi:hypothetical protein
VLWRGAFQPRKDELPRETVARCYPALIAARRLSYQALAHGTLTVAELRETSRDPSQDADAFLERVRQQVGR